MGRGGEGRGGEGRGGELASQTLLHFIPRVTESQYYIASSYPGLPHFLVKLLFPMNRQLYMGISDKLEGDALMLKGN